MTGSVFAYDVWSCGDGGLLRFFLSELPPPARGMDGTWSELYDGIRFCNSYFILFFAIYVVV